MTDAGREQDNEPGHVVAPASEIAADLPVVDGVVPAPAGSSPDFAPPDRGCADAQEAGQSSRSVFEADGVGTDPPVATGSNNVDDEGSCIAAVSQPPATSSSSAAAGSSQEVAHTQNCQGSEGSSQSPRCEGRHAPERGASLFFQNEALRLLLNNSLALLQ